MHWFFALLWGWGGPSVEGVPKRDVQAGTRKELRTREGGCRVRFEAGKVAWIAGRRRIPQEKSGVFGGVGCEASGS